MAPKKTTKLAKSENVNDELDAELAGTKFGKFVDLAENMVDMSVECVPTGFPQLDLILHRDLKGLPKGRDIEIFSKEPESGKSSIAMDILKSWQRQGYRTALIDVERTLTVEYLQKLGILTDPKQDPFKYALRIIRPEEAMSAEEVLDLIRGASQIFDLIVVDSLAAMDIEANLEKSSEDSNKIGAMALLMSNFLKKNVAKRATVVWINQTRMQIGGYSPTGQTRHIPTCGKALGFYASIILDLSVVERLKDGEDIYAYRVKVHTAKNKVSPQWRTALMTYVFDEGFSVDYDYFDLALKMGVIEKKGSWLQFGDFRQQGELNFYRALKSNPDVSGALRQAVDGDSILEEVEVL